MGNACGKRAWWGTEQYYRDLFEQQAAEERRAQEEKQAEQDRIVQEENEGALRAAEAEAARRAQFEADTTLLLKQMVARGELVDSVDVDKRIAAAKAEGEEQVAAAVSDYKTKLSELEIQLAKLDAAAKEDIKTLSEDVAALRTKLAIWDPPLDEIKDGNDCSQYKPKYLTSEDMDKILQLCKDDYHELKMHLDAFNEKFDQMRSDMVNQAESTEADYLEAKMTLKALESELQSALATLGTVHQRVTELEVGGVDGEQSEQEEDIECPSCSSFATSLAPSAAGSKRGAGTKTATGPPLPTVTEPAGSDSDSSEAEEVVIPYTTGKLGIDTVELIDWDKLLLVEKKKRNRLSEIDKLTVRQLLSPPLRSKITSWKRWKELTFHWIRDLRRVRVGWTEMGAQVLSQSFTGMEGEYAVAESASTTRDIIAIMKKVDLKFATPTRGMIEKLEEWVPLITRDDGQDPLLFLHLLGMVFVGEKRIGIPRSEHSKVSRALSALRLHGDKEMAARSQLPASVEVMDYQQLEHVIDSLKVQDAARYDLQGKKQEKKKVGEPNYLNDLLGLLGDRRGRGDNAHHTALNEYFNSDGTAATASAEGHAFATSGAPGGGQKPTSAPATPRGGVGGRFVPKTEAERHEEDKKFWTNREKIGVDQKKTMLAERMATLKRQNDADEYWCPLGDWCTALRTTGKCKGQHMKAEYGRGMRRLQRDNPTKYKELQDAKRKAAEEKKKKDAAAKAS
eukprot:g18107.t1